MKQGPASKSLSRARWPRLPVLALDALASVPQTARKLSLRMSSWNPLAAVHSQQVGSPPLMTCYRERLMTTSVTQAAAADVVVASELCALNDGRM